MPQVIIVSNRLPVSVKKENGELSFSPSVGGLATGLSSYVRDRKNTWIGWPGIASDELTEADKQIVVEELAKHNCTPVFLTKRQLDDFYNGYSNAVLWPIFHNLPATNKQDAQHTKWWKAYRAVNQQYADIVAEQASKGSRIWVHDYQLLLLPELLRADKKAASIIGFFLHIPFPTVKGFAKLAEHKRLLQGILGADLIGLHTSRYVQAFLDNCQEAGIGIVSPGQVVLPDHAIRVAEFPMGIDYERYASATKSKAVKAAIKRYKKRYKGLKVIVAVDRLDPSKGLVERLKAYREFLDRNPKLHGKVVFSMVAAPSRTEIDAYKNLSKRLDELAADINKTYGTPKWQPIDYMNVTQPFEEVTALFAMADVAFIAPLRDGMNLAAKEFVASNRKKGVLILSQTAGAAEELKDALIVNPRKQETSVDALQQALTMRRRELRSRLKRMQTQLSTHTVQSWAKDFVDTLQQPVPGTKLRAVSLQKRKLRQQLRSDYQRAHKRLLLLDYDGSLVPFQQNYATADPPKAVLHLLEALAQDKRNDVVLVSGRSSENLERWFSHLPISLVGEHGGATKKAGNKTWHKIEKDEHRWKQAVLPILERYAAKTPKARVENKDHSLVWHYRGAPPYYAQKHVVTLKRLLKPLTKQYHIEVFQGNKILEIKDPRINKGDAVEPWLKQKHEFVLALGDDFTDEELFESMPDTAYTIKVGRGSTAAHYRLPDYEEVRKLLRKLVVSS
jgi:trehalose 6-phosphate synthase/phosphatase